MKNIPEVAETKLIGGNRRQVRIQFDPLLLAARNIDHEYVEYPGEGHGFRKSETNIDAIEKETRFYRRILGIGHLEK